MPKGYLPSQTCVHSMGYHFVWCPKYCRKPLTNSISKRLKELIYEKAKTISCRVLRLKVTSNYVHLFIQGHPKLSPNTIIGQIKGYTANRLRKEFPELKKKLPTLWTRSYFVSTHNHISDKVIEKYIEEQKGI